MYNKLLAVSLKRGLPELTTCCVLQSKEQLKQLRAQKAVSAQQAASAEKAKSTAAAAATAVIQPKSRSTAGMPPPAPRAPSGSVAGAASSKAALNNSLGRPQAAEIQPRPKQSGQRSVNGSAEQPAQPSGVQPTTAAHTQSKANLLLSLSL